MLVGFQLLNLLIPFLYVRVALLHPAYTSILLFLCAGVQFYVNQFYIFDSATMALNLKKKK